MATLKAVEGKEAELEAALSEMVGKVEGETGTLVYALHRKRGEPGTFVFYELYDGQDAVAAHSGSDAMKELQGTLAGSGLVGGRPDIVMLEPVVAKGT
jgi:quinol monooxygenase YgiN